MTDRATTSPSVLRPDEIDNLRGDTPGVAHRVHLNHAGSSLPSQAVIDAQIAHLRRESEIGGYEAADERTDDDAAVYASIASLIGASAGEIARAEHATSAWNAGFWSVPMKPGQRIVTAHAAYGANAVAFLRAVERRKITIDVIPDDEHGQVDVDELAARLDDDVALVAVTHVPTNGGLVNPVERIGALTKQAGVPFLLDACQSIGQRVIDVDAIGCDLLSATGRKYLRGPRGTGFLYASNRVLDRLIPDHPDHHGATWTAPDRFELASSAQRFEHWEYNHAAWLALGVAVDEARTLGLDRIQATVVELAASFRSRLSSTGVRVMDLGTQRCGIVTITSDRFDATTAKAALAAAGVNVSIAKPSSTRFDSSARSLGPLVRLSVHYLTTSDELDTAVAIIGDLQTKG